MKLPNFSVGSRMANVSFYSRGNVLPQLMRAPIFRNTTCESGDGTESCECAVGDKCVTTHGSCSCKDASARIPLYRGYMGNGTGATLGEVALSSRRRGRFGPTLPTSTAVNCRSETTQVPCGTLEGGGTMYCPGEPRTVCDYALKWPG